MPLILTALALATVLSAAETPVTPTPSQSLAAHVQFEAPKGWHREEYANSGGADPVVAFVAGADRIAIRLFGSHGSGYKNPVAFLASPAARTLGAPAAKTGTVPVAGRTLALYQRGVPADFADPHAAQTKPARMGAEVFGVLPASGGRFVVLSYARESPVPDPAKRGKKAWELFLKTIKLIDRKT